MSAKTPEERRQEGARETPPTPPGTGKRTPGAGDPTPGAGDPTPGTGKRTPGAGDPTPGTGKRTPGAGDPTADTGNLSAAGLTPSTRDLTPGGPPLDLLPTAGQPTPERADAARNRRKILDAAARIVAEVGPEAVTMNQVAHASGIGVGTVYRRFGDVAQLLWALLDDRERQFQQAYMSGPPPLGPGAPAAERLSAFFDALIDRVIEQRELLLAAQAAAPSARYTSGAYLAMHTHVALLVTQLRPEANGALLAHLLLAPFSPSLMHHLTVERNLSAEELKAGVADLLTLTGPA